MASLALATGSLILGTGISLAGQRAAQESTVAGAEAQIEIEDMNRAFQKNLFEGQIERQQPFIDAGNIALPDLVKAIQNKGDASSLPSATLRRDIVGEFLGEQSPDFIREQAFGDIDASETEINKGRLSNLVNVGLGAVSGEAQTGANLAANLENSFIKEGNIQGQSLQDQAIARQNQGATVLRSLSTLPQLYAATAGRGNRLPDFDTPSGFGTYNSGTGFRSAFER